MAPSRPVGLAPKLALALTATLLTLAPFEWWARREFDRRNSGLADVDTTKIEDPSNLKLGDLLKPSADPEIVFELRPNVDGAFMGRPYRSNSHGMRDREIALEKPPGQRRIAVIGDSLAFGWGVAVEESICDVTERALRQALPNESIEVLNFCVPGYNSWQESQVLEKRVLAFSPDALVVQYYYNDVHLPFFLLDKPAKPLFCLYPLLTGRLSTVQENSAALTMPSREGVENDSVVADWRKDEALVPQAYKHMVGYAGVERAFERIARLGKERGIPVVLLGITIPTQAKIDTSEEFPLDRITDPQIDAFARQFGFERVDTLSPIARTLRQVKGKITDLVLSQSDWHFNTVGNRIIGNALAESLKSVLARTPTQR